jgi:hypothetical protein
MQRLNGFSYTVVLYPKRHNHKKKIRSKNALALMLTYFWLQKSRAGAGMGASQILLGAEAASF